MFEKPKIAAIGLRKPLCEWQRVNKSYLKTSITGFTVITVNLFTVYRRCDKAGRVDKPFKASVTTSAINHLKTLHHVAQGSCDTDPGSIDDSDVQVSPPKRQRSTPITMPKSKVTQVEELAVGFLINTSNPFSTFSNQYIQRILNLFNHNTPPNHYAIIAIFSHFINKLGKQSQYLLARRRQLGAHAGKNIAPTMLIVINNFGILDQVGVTVCDNASNNDTCLKALYPSISDLFTKTDAE
ncbi:hypothetical protein CcaCcLH18_14247 [Colletotrichum camelliae]|nr:hypothetical protein CcaCcLH18_14247 [Colletotrichum camelliae]